MFELAAKLVAEEKVAAGYIEPIQKRGHEALDHGSSAPVPGEAGPAPAAAEVLAFFEHGLGCTTLLDQLEGEERRDRRRLLLDLLIVHGPPSRALARKRLLDSMRTTAPDFARRNWVYLMRLLPRPGDEPVEPEVEAIASLANPGKTPFLVKEALLYLGYTRHARAAQALVSLLRTWEEHVAHATDDVEARGPGRLSIGSRARWRVRADRGPGARSSTMRCRGARSSERRWHASASWAPRISRARLTWSSGSWTRSAT